MISNCKHDHTISSSSSSHNTTTITTAANIVDDSKDNNGNGKDLSPSKTTGIFTNSNNRPLSLSADDDKSNATNANTNNVVVATETKKSAIFQTDDFLNFLANEVDIHSLMIVTKDGQRMSASFNGPTAATLSGQAKSGPPSYYFKSLDMLKSLDSTAGARAGTGADGDSIEPTMFQSTVSLEFFPSIELGKGPPSMGGTTVMESDPFVSREWAMEYGKSHIDVSYSSCFRDPFKQNGRYVSTLNKTEDVAMDTGSSGGGSASLPPKKRTAAQASATGGAPENNKTDWNAMFKSALKPLVDAASVAQREHHPDDDEEETPPEELLAGMRNKVPVGTFERINSSTASNHYHYNGSDGEGGASAKKKSSKRKPRKIIPANKEYVDFTDKVRE
jgi:hypothetical protein